MIKPAELLLGKTLDGGFTVKKKVPKRAGGTGGHFSVCYVAEKDGKEYFLKATDTTFVRTGKSGADGLRDALTAFTYERDILELAIAHAMTRVVRVLASGEVPVKLKVAGMGEIELPVFYLIFERGEDSLRDQMQTGLAVKPIDKLKALHHIALGVRQLHAKGVAHQDLKPSNVMRFLEEQEAAAAAAAKELDHYKIADMGCASQKGKAALHDSLPVPGDRRYAPPEGLYEQNTAFDFERRRFGADLYMLASLTVQLFTGATMSAAMQRKLPDTHRISRWKGPYDQLLPRLIEAFDGVLLDLRKDWPYRKEEPRIAERLELMTRHLCCPDPHRRGHPRALGTVNPLDIDRYVSLFAELIHLASIAERRQAADLARIAAASDPQAA